MSISALIIDDERLARDELKYLLDSIGGVDVVAQGANGIEAVELIEEHQPDLVFLDVQMPGMDGFGVLERLMALRRQSDEEAEPMPQIVFATAFDQYAVRAFEVNAVDYLLKPFDRSRVLAAVERVRARLANGNAGTAAAHQEQPIEPQHLVHANIGTRIGASVDSMIDSKIDALLRLLKNTPSTHGGAQSARAPAPKLIVQAQSRLLLIDQAEICFAAIDDGVIRIVTRTFEGQSKCRTLEELMDLLEPAHFWRAHRGYVVNIDHIREVVPWFKSSYQLRMNDKQQTEIPVSRAQTKRLKELFNL